MGNFDQFADSYQRVHTENVRVTGENSEYFAQYKARYIARRMGAQFSGRILDYGCGVGMLSNYMKQVFPHAMVDGYDISDASIAKVDTGIRTQGTFTSDWSQVGRHYNLIAVTNVMHHVPPDKRQDVIASLRDRLAPRGILIIVEHNPLNPLTRWAVANCAFDDGGQLCVRRRCNPAAHVGSAGIRSAQWLGSFASGLHHVLPASAGMVSSSGTTPELVPCGSSIRPDGATSR